VMGSIRFAQSDGDAVTASTGEDSLASTSAERRDGGTVVE
jgi:hypothetical protein